MLKFHHAGAQRRRECGVIFIALLAVVLLMGCGDDPPHEDGGFIPVGEWIGPDDYGDPDKYIITNTKITYVDPWNMNNFAGEVAAAINFSNDAGVVIVKILNDPVPDAFTQNKYTCVYYRDYTSSNVKLSPPLDAQWEYIEVDTLNEAKNIFIVDNVGDHVLAWGSYTK